MKGRFARVSRIALLGPAISLVTCTGGDDASMEEYAPRSDDAAIVSVSLGTNAEDTWDPAQAGTEFPEGIDRVVVWYRWEDAEEGLKIDNRWSTDGIVVLEQGETISEAAGSAAWFLKMGAGGPLPAGSYQVELLENGAIVTTIPFRIGQ